MKVAVIGGGFAGLATAYFLQEFEEIQVTVFEKSRIGAGASGASSGLLHPYPGIMARRSQKAEEALAITKQLIRIAEKHTPKMVSSNLGIFRESLNEEQRQRLIDHCATYGDIEQLDRTLFLIHSGVTVISSHYLEGLHAAIKKRGGETRIEEVKSLRDLQEFDHVIIAAGYGIQTFAECSDLKVKFLKGQSLKIAAQPLHDKSFISKGYLAHLGSDQEFEIGSTYERVFENHHPNLEVAKALLKDKLKQYPEKEILSCKAGVRVCPTGHYLPIVKRVSEKATVFTGLGSRGLLYHGYFGRQVANQIAQNSLIT